MKYMRSKPRVKHEYDFRSYRTSQSILQLVRDAVLNIQARVPVAILRRLKQIISIRKLYHRSPSSMVVIWPWTPAGMSDIQVQVDWSLVFCLFDLFT